MATVIALIVGCLCQQVGYIVVVAAEGLRFLRIFVVILIVIAIVARRCWRRRVSSMRGYAQ